MNTKWQKEYPLERELKNLLKEFRVLVRGFRKWLFTYPKDKMDKIAHIIDVICFSLLLFSLILRGFRF